MKLVTVATESQGYFPVLLESCERLGYRMANQHHHQSVMSSSSELVILGWGEKWRGYAWRMKLVIDYLDSLMVSGGGAGGSSSHGSSGDEVVCFIDAYDVVMLQPPSVLEQRFRATGKEIVVALDRNPIPAAELLSRFKFGTCGSTRINGGTYVGYASSIRRMLAEICSEYDCSDRKVNDQAILTRYCAKHISSSSSSGPEQSSVIGVDTARDIFLVVVRCWREVDMAAEGIDVDDAGLLSYVDPAGEVHYPCVVHAVWQTRISSVNRSLGYSHVELPPFWPTAVKYYLPEFLPSGYVLASAALVLVVVIFLVLVIIGRSTAFRQKTKGFNGLRRTRMTTK
jgi:hypothetical protein